MRKFQVSIGHFFKQSIRGFERHAIVEHCLLTVFPFKGGRNRGAVKGTDRAGRGGGGFPVHILVSLKFKMLSEMLI